MKILDYILCEDIREEVGRKLTLVGTFHDQIVLNYTKNNPVKWPVMLRLAMYLKILCEEGDNYDTLKLDFSEGDSGKTLLKMGTKITKAHKEGTPIVLNWLIPNLQISSETELKLRLDCIAHEKVAAIIEPYLQYRVTMKEHEPERIGQGKAKKNK